MQENWTGTLLEHLPTLQDFLTPEAFRRQWPSGRVPGIYLLLRRGHIVYVGQSSKLLLRIQDHKRDAKKDFDEVRYWPCDGSASFRLRLETILIATYLPRYNRGVHLGLSGGKMWEIRWPRSRTSKKAVRG